MRIKLIDPSGNGTGIYGKDGEYKAGTEFTVKKEDLPAGWEGRYQVVSEDDDADGKTAVTGNAASGASGASSEPAKGPFTVNDGGNGWFTLTDANGKEYGKKLRQADVDAFNDLSDEDKAAFFAA